MLIDWNHFTPGLSLAGGVLLGLASALFILVNGRILGISGILGGCSSPRRVMWHGAWPLCSASWPLPCCMPACGAWEVRIEAGWGTVVAAGLLVGIGTRYASGCTSGHGVCGLSRLSPRSLVATVSFMAAGFVVVYLVRHALG